MTTGQSRGGARGQQAANYSLRTTGSPLEHLLISGMTCFSPDVILLCFFFFWMLIQFELEFYDFANFLNFKSVFLTSVEKDE